MDVVRIGAIGLGSMGAGMASSLRARGFAVCGFDVNPSVLAAFAAQGGEVASTTAEAAQDANFLLVVVVNAAQTREILFGSEGVANRLAKGGVVISCATMSPDDASSLASDAEALGLDWVDAPISGGATKAATGQLTIMGSGRPSAFAKARPILEAMATTVHELGPEAGVGASFKLVNQLLAGVHIAAACEAMVLAKRLELDLNKVYEVIIGSAGNSWMFENRVPHILDGNYSPASAVNLFTKDLGIVSDIGHSQTLPLPVTATALQLFLMTSAAGMGDDDDASVARLLAKIAGLKLPNANSD